MSHSSESLETLTALYRISQAASEAASPDDAYQTIIEEIQQRFAPSSAAISLISPNTGLLEIEYAYGYPPNLDELSIHLGKGLRGRVAFNGTPLLCNDVDTDPRYVKLIDGVGSKIAAPMISQGHIIGLIDVDRPDKDAFSESDLHALSLISSEAARVLQTVWSTRQLVIQSEQLKALIDAGQNFVSNLEIHSLWESVTDAALLLTNAKFCTLQRVDEKTRDIIMQTTRPQDPKYVESVGCIKPNESLAGAAIRTRRQVEFTDISTSSEFELKDLPRDMNVTSCLSTPMTFEGKVIGIINVFTEEKHRFSNSERRFVQAFASLSAVAAQNADLYSRVFNTEERLRKSERLTTLGLLAAEIAHEIRNPLTVIKLLFGSLELQYSEGDPRNKDKHVIQEKIDHLEEIVSKVLSFGKAPTSLFTRWEIDELIADTCLLVRHKMAQQKIKLRHEALERPAHVHGNKGQLQQVLLNLIINAADAMPEGGNLSIAAKLEDNGSNKTIAIYVEDSGNGIPPDLVEHVFDSFLSGKSEGTGLGLSIVKRILKSHHGDVRVTKSDSLGTTIRIQLPLV